MKKTVFSLVVLTIVLFGCASVPKEFDSTPTPFEGEWRNYAEKWNDEVYVFNGNSWRYTCNDESKNGSGLFVLKGNDITLYKDNGKKWWWNSKYIVNNAIFKITWNRERYVLFMKQPVKEFVSDGELSSKLQGTWKAFDVNVIYTFSENRFMYITDKKSQKNFEGTFETNDDGLLKITVPEGEILFHITFKTDTNIRSEVIKTILNIQYGDFFKQ